MLGDIPPESAAGFDRLKWVELYRGPYSRAEPILKRLTNAKYPVWWSRLDVVEGLDEIAISVPARLLEEVRRLLDDDPAP